MNFSFEPAPALLTALLYIALFAGVEIWSRRRHPDSETSRKLVHFGGGMIALLFPTIFRSHWSVLLLAVGFFALLIVTKRSGKLRSVQGVDRITVGEIIYPLAIWLVLFLSTLAGGPASYRVAVLILAVADALAGLIGKRFGRHPYRVAGGSKSMEGSATFLAATMAIICGGYWSAGTFGIEALLAAALCALVLTGVEAISSKGIDNFTVPLAAWGLLQLVRSSAGELLLEIALVSAAGAVALWLTTRLRWLRVEHAILAVLAGYALRLLMLYG